jgi:hypothetical protein
MFAPHTVFDRERSRRIPSPRRCSFELNVFPRRMIANESARTKKGTGIDEMLRIIFSFRSIILEEMRGTKSAVTTKRTTIPTIGL